MDALEQHLNAQLERSRSFFWNRVRWELVCSQLPSGRIEVVDVGAGPGMLGDFLAQRRPQAEYRFVEPIAGLEQQLEARFGAEANWRERDFAGASHVTLMDVLEHQEDDRAFMAELVAKMEPGATLLLTVPALPSLWSQWDTALGHYRRYTKPTLRAAVAGLPLELDEQSYLFPELVPLGWVRRRQQPQEGEAEFPDLPRALNTALYGVGRATTALRRVWPLGTSLFAVFRRTG